MTLLEEIMQRCSDELRASRDSDAIAAALSFGRTRVVSRLGGIGAIMEALGPANGAQVLDVLDALKASNAALKWGWVLLERGELDFGSPATRSMIDGLRDAGAMTEAVASALKALAEQPDPVAEIDVRRAIWADNGEYLA